MARGSLVLVAIGAVLVSASTAHAADEARLELDAAQSRYRVIITADKPLTFDLGQLERAVGGAPWRARIFVVDAQDRVQCNQGPAGTFYGEGYATSSMSSESLLKSLGQFKGAPKRLKAGQRFESDWFEVNGLFVMMNHCAQEPDRAKWRTFQISVRLVTSKGPLEARSGWMDIPASVRAERP